MVFLGGRLYWLFYINIKVAYKRLVKMRILVFYLCLVLALLYGTEKIQQIQYLNHKYLVFNLSFSHNISQNLQYIPPLVQKSLLNDFNLSYLKIKMAHLSPPSSTLDFPSHGIQIIMNAETINTQRLIHLLNGVFGVSLKSLINQYEFSFNNQKYIFYSDPDDIFCSQNLQQILNLIPCGKSSGVISSLPNDLFKRYTGFQFNWKIINQTVQFQFDFIAQIDKNTNQYLVRGLKCGVYDESQVITANGLQLYQSYSKVFKLNSTKKENLNFFESKRWVSGNWYSHRGILVHQVRITSNIFKVTLYEHFGKYMEPILNDIQISSDTRVNLNFDVHIKKTHQNKLVVIQIHNTNDQVIYVKIPYQKKIRNFQYLQATNRGSSQQFLKAILVIQKDRNSQQMMLISDENLIDKVIEPDNGMPFNIFTFTMALIGYIWISVWKTFVKLNQQ